MTDLSDLTAEDVRRYLRSEGWGEGWTRDHETAEDLRLAKNRRKVLARVARYDERTLAEVVAAVRDMRDEVQAADEARIPALPLDPDVDAAVEALARQHDRSGEAQAIPAAEERVVARCARCPAGRFDGTLGWAITCGLAGGRDAALDPDDTTPPDWCPLRRGPVTLRLEER